MTHIAELEAVFLIHRRAYRETSALLEIFSQEYGRIGVVARGASRPRSSLRTALIPFTPLLMSWSGRGDLATLRSVEVAHSAADRKQANSTQWHQGLQGNALISGLYINELLMRLTHRHDPHPELFAAYADAIFDLARPAAIEQVLRIFEKRLLDAIGYGLILTAEVDSGNPIIAEQRYRYLADQGPIRDPGHAVDGVDISGKTMLALAAERELNVDEQREAKRLMRFVLRVYLGDRPLASRELFR